jgi:hypothetical protein
LNARDLPVVCAAILTTVTGRCELALEIVRTTARAISTSDRDERLAVFERLVEARRLRHGA